MNDKDEALKMALEALVEVKSWKSPTRWDGCFDKEITAIKKALSSCQCPECKVLLHASDCAVHNEPAYPKGECNCGAQPEQKPVAWMNDMGTHIDLNVSGRGTPLYTPPPQRKPLTDEEVNKLVDDEDWYNDPHGFVRVIEAKLRSKND